MCQPQGNPAYYLKLFDFLNKFVYFLQAYEAAASHFLEALNFQSAGRNHTGSESSEAAAKTISGHVRVMSENIWSSLRLTLGLMGKRDLYTLIEKRDLPSLNHKLSVEK